MRRICVTHFEYAPQKLHLYWEFGWILEPNFINLCMVYRIPPWKYLFNQKIISESYQMIKQIWCVYPLNKRKILVDYDHMPNNSPYQLFYTR